MRILSTFQDEDLTEGTRVGRYLVLRDIDGRRHALAASAVQAACEEEDDVLLFLSGGRRQPPPRHRARLAGRKRLIDVGLPSAPAQAPPAPPA
jgi:hypothetical protein